MKKQTYSKVTFANMGLRKVDFLLRNVRLEECTFDNCVLALPCSIENTARVENIDAVKCKILSSHVGPVIFSNVHIKDLLIDDMLVLRGALFDSVIFEGKIGNIIFSPSVAFAYYNPETDVPLQEEFDRRRQHFYSKVDWAIDISKALFTECDIDGIPARLIKRDTATQAIVTRERALKKSWRNKISANNSLWLFVIDQFLESNEEDIVLVAPKRASKKEFTKLLNGIEELRKLGVAEPD
jgi:hypothetical protein